jgi:hypothetical protein
MARTEVKPEDSVFETVRNCDVGVVEIKAFSGNSLFRANSQHDSPGGRNDSPRQPRETNRGLPGVRKGGR